MSKSELQARLAELHSESFGWALNCCRGDAPQAEDVLQIAYLKILDGRATFGGKSEFKTWLFGVIRNTGREERRRQRLRSLGLLRLRSKGRRTRTWSNWFAMCCRTSNALGGPTTFTPEQVTDLIALACEKPSDSGLPVSHWTQAGSGARSHQARYR